MTEDLLSQTPLSIFQTYSRPEIQKISNSLSTISTQKHEDIRNLVGSKYRDLLISADEIKLMEELCIKQDRQLYDLIFSKGKHGIDSKIGKFVDGSNGDPIIINPRDKVDEIKNRSDFFIKLSKFLKISSSDELEIIEEKINELGDEWNDKNQVILEKFKEIEVIIYTQVGHIDDITSLTKYKRFVETREEFDQNKFQELLMSRVVDLINLENLKNVLINFPEFKTVLEKDYLEELEKKFSELSDEIQGIDLSKSSDEKLSLYELKFDDEEYLTKVEFLSKGLVYPEYQTISVKLQETRLLLQYLNIINPGISSKLNNQYIKILGDFQKHAKDQGDSLLIKYLDSKIHNVSLK